MTIIRCTFASFVVGLFFLGAPALAQNSSDRPAAISGFVFVDNNHNGIPDKGEEGIAGVVISDQVNVVRTDDKGYYRIDHLAGNGFVFISMPDGYKSESLFWQLAVKEEINFPLTRSSNPVSFTFIQASDTHISEKTMDRMQKFRSIVDSVKPDFVIITGDLVKDALRVPEKEARGYYELFRQEIGKLTTPVWCIPGNHEIFGIERHLSLVSTQNPLYGRKMYHYYFGPDYYSFNYGGFHFIGLNSVEFDDLWYYGRVDSTQIEWLKRDVATVNPSTPIITFQHIPFFSGGFSMSTYEETGPMQSLVREHGVLQYRQIVSNAREVLAILNGHNYPLALAGHYHFQQKFSLEGVQTRFEQTAAVIGPSEIGYLKMPSGVTLYRVSKGMIDGGTFIRLDK
jgi:Calcineurin-like phosphoesterase/N terminal of Calcineurin-like phosphoesterase